MVDRENIEKFGWVVAWTYSWGNLVAMWLGYSGSVAILSTYFRGRSPGEIIGIFVTVLVVLIIGPLILTLGRKKEEKEQGWIAQQISNQINGYAKHVESGVKGAWNASEFSNGFDAARQPGGGGIVLAPIVHNDLPIYWMLANLTLRFEVYNGKKNTTEKEKEMSLFIANTISEEFRKETYELPDGTRPQTKIPLRDAKWIPEINDLLEIYLDRKKKWTIAKLQALNFYQTGLNQLRPGGSRDMNVIKALQGELEGATQNAQKAFERMIRAIIAISAVRVLTSIREIHLDQYNVAGAGGAHPHFYAFLQPGFHRADGTYEPKYITELQTDAKGNIITRNGVVQTVRDVAVGEDDFVEVDMQGNVLAINDAKPKKKYRISNRNPYAMKAYPIDKASEALGSSWAQFIKHLRMGVLNPLSTSVEAYTYAFKTIRKEYNFSDIRDKVQLFKELQEGHADTTASQGDPATDLIALEDPNAGYFEWRGIERFDGSDADDNTPYPSVSTEGLSLYLSRKLAYIGTHEAQEDLKHFVGVGPKGYLKLKALKEQAKGG